MEKLKAPGRGKNTALAFVVLLILWYLLSITLKLSFLPSPVAVLADAFALFGSGLLPHIGWSLWRIFAGIGISLLLGLICGLSMGYFPKADRILSPVVYLLYPIPKIALLPLVMLFCGLGDGAKITMIVLIVVFQIIVAARDAVGNIPRETYRGMQALGASTGQIFRLVVIPATLPGIFSAVRISLGTALSVLFFTETFGTQYGLGYFIMDAWNRVNYTDMFAGILVLGILGFALFRLVDFAAAHCCRWQQRG